MGMKNPTGKLPFTEKEFQGMIDELLHRDPPSFVMLCEIAQRTLKSTVKFWCSTDSVLRGRSLEEDILQEVLIRLIQKTVSGFLLRADGGGKLNYDPAGFKSWMFTVATNIKNDFRQKEINRDNRSLSLDNGDNASLEWHEALQELPASAFLEEQFRRDVLLQIFDSAVAFRSVPYKTLTWFSQVYLMLMYQMEKKDTNRLIFRFYHEKTLNEMFLMLDASAAKCLPWMRWSEEQKRTILCELAKPNPKSGKSFGDTLYGDCFMKSKTPEACISDWVNRINEKMKSEKEKWNI